MTLPRKKVTGNVWLIITIISIFLSHLGHGQILREASSSLGVDHKTIDQRRISGGVVLFDYDLDHHLDIFLTGGTGTDKLYHNKGYGVFEEHTTSALLGFTANYPTVGAGAADLDNDGYPDLVITTQEGYPIILLRNRGDGTFEDRTGSSGVSGFTDWSTSVSFADVNLDGLLDMYIGNYANFLTEPFDHSLTGGQSNQLLINRGNFTFQEVASHYQVENQNSTTLSATFLDVDGDYDLDLWVGNDFGQNFQPNTLYINEYPEERFSDQSQIYGVNAQINAMGFAKGDFNQDGLQEVYISNMADNLCYARDRPEATFREIAQQNGTGIPAYTSWGAAFVDLENNGTKELVVANGAMLDFSSSVHPNLLFAFSQGQFSEMNNTGIEDGGTARGLAIGDLNLDGLQDIVINQVNLDEQGQHKTQIYVNQYPEKQHFIRIKLQGNTANRPGIGAQVVLFTKSGTFIQEVDGGSSYLSFHEPTCHFGIGERSSIEKISVTWPGGKQVDYKDFIVDNTYLLVENGAKELILPESPLSTSGIPPEENSLRVFYHKGHLKSNREFSDLVQVKVHNLQGRLLHTLETKSKLHLPFSMPVGMYLVAVEGDRFYHQEKIFVHE